MSFRVRAVAGFFVAGAAGRGMRRRSYQKTVPSGTPGEPTWAPWPSALHDARHSGASTSDGPQSGKFRWQRQLETSITPGPVIGADGTIYVASNTGIFHALDPATGNDRWTYDLGHAGGGDLSVSPHSCCPVATFSYRAHNSWSHCRQRAYTSGHRTSRAYRLLRSPPTETASMSATCPAA
ncbi:outer membrane protein assembly factor BamB family protein [Fodinicola feengrottensis]|uniref:outer membrane protein assembly factor BamB family protein n=1 Tax=Fodinicola feengrottensis TaxID=435914 RepID=UPI0024411487|nr:PQQ-binding-like beta-propeller repeat protein [Fodinicola feengrottensis]